LLAIWNRAKGKERDALLWGDEVGSTCNVDLTLGLLAQVEYIVVNYSDAEPNVTLSLRQADILKALAYDERLLKGGGCVPDLQKVSHDK
jgi:glutamate--cysteine ligase catalytic subunit